MGVGIGERTAGVDRLTKSYVLRLVFELAPSPEAGDEFRDSFIDPLFGAIYDESGEGLETWKAISRAEVALQAGQPITIYRHELRAAADAYITGPGWIRHPYLDWLAVNTLIYAETSATFASLGGYQWLDKKGEFRWRMAAWLGAVLLIKWSIWVIMLLAATATDLWWPAPAFIALTVFVQFSKAKAKRKRGKLVDLMLSVYDSTRTSTLSWTVVWDLLTKSRDAGAVWDPELYRLVESRIAHRT